VAIFCATPHVIASASEAISCKKNTPVIASASEAIFDKNKHSMRLLRRPAPRNDGKELVKDCHENFSNFLAMTGICCWGRNPNLQFMKIAVFIMYL